MKSVLIIDAQKMMLEYIRDKLTEEDIRVEVADSQRDALPKLFSILPDLIIINVKDTLYELDEFFSKKSADINAKRIPMILTGPVIEKDDAADLVKYGVIKYFARPVKFDLFFESVGRVLHFPFAIDTTPCVLDVHWNDDIIFVEVAMGLNREKLSMLKYKLSEIIDHNEISNPKVVLMLTSLSLSFVDGYNLELLFDNLTSDSRISNQNIKVLSLDSITKEFIDGHQNLNGIQVVKSLSDVLGSLVAGSGSGSIEEVISDKILVSNVTGDDSVEMRFSSDMGLSDSESDSVVKTSENKRVAIIDDEAPVRNYLSAAFQTINAEITEFTSGNDFISKIANLNFDVIILDIYMPGFTGFDVLKYMKDNNISTPVIVYSQIVRKDYIMQALNLGAKSYLIKPQPQQALVQKALEVMNV